MVWVYLLGVTTFFFGSTPLAALLPAVGAVFVLAFGVAVAAGLTAVLLVGVLALVLVTLLSRALAFVFTYVTDYNALYGSIGVILAVQLWLYFNMIVLLIGFELNTSISKARREHTDTLRIKAQRV